VRVCLYSHAFWPSIGGLETSSALFAEYLHHKGIEVTLVTQTPLNGHEEAAPFRVVRKPRAAELSRLIASHDLVHCNCMSVRAASTAFRRGVPLIVTHQSYNAAVPGSLGALVDMVKNEGPQRPPHAALSALGMRLVDVNVCVSRFVLERLKPPRGIVIYNPVSPIFRPLPAAGRTDRFVFVGRLVTDKGCHVLLRALAECARRGHALALDIYGEGPEKERLEALTRECNLSGQVKFHGSIHGEALVEAYNRSLAVVVPSVWQEPGALVPLEAMGCGRAVIASAAGGLTEVVTGVGMTFPNGNVQVLADCLVRLVESPALRQQAEERGKDFARNCRRDVIGDRYLQLYCALLSERKARREKTQLMPV